MVRLAVALIMFVSGMAPAISCESLETPEQTFSLELSCSAERTSSSLVENQENPSRDRNDSKQLPCAFCSPICHHAVTLPTYSVFLPILEASSFFNIPSDEYSGVDLESPKEPPRFA